MHLTWGGLLASLWGCLPPPWGSKAPLKWGLSGLGLGSSPWGFLGGGGGVWKWGGDFTYLLFPAVVMGLGLRKTLILK